MFQTVREVPPGPGFLLSLHQLRLLRSVFSGIPERHPAEVTYVDPLARRAFLSRAEGIEEQFRKTLDPDRDCFRLTLNDCETEGFIGLLAERPAHCGLRRTFLRQARSENAVVKPDLLKWIDCLSEGASLGLAAFRSGLEVPRAAVEPNRTIWIEMDAVLDL